MLRQFARPNLYNKYLKLILNNQIKSKEQEKWIFVVCRGVHNQKQLQQNNNAPEPSLNKLDETIENRCSKGPSTFTARSHTCGELGVQNVGQNVTLYGWLEFQRMNKFLTLRDAYGITQIIVPENVQHKFLTLDNIPFESILKITGVVARRPEAMVNPKQKTGEIEVIMESLDVINEVKEKLPFDIRSFNKAKEHIRMRHRYLDLRFPEMQQNLRLRSQMLMDMRKYLIDTQAFVEVETPTLFRRTPGGAQEFIVPTRNPGQFYSLVQSPQQFKQMLMAGGVDRYFQFARCYRDEGSRPDRQPEFTQLDIELSYPKQNSILALVEELLYNSWPIDKDPIEIPFPRMTYTEAMNRFGSDKPDIRFGLELSDITNLVSINNTNIHDFACYMIKIPTLQASLTKSIKSTLNELAKKYPDVKFVQSIITIDWSSTKLANIFGEDVLKRIQFEQNLGIDDVVFIAYGDKTRTQTLLGKVRILYKELLETNNINIPTHTKNKFNFLWITDFPLFTLETDQEIFGSLSSTHHPFTAPHPEDLHKLETEPLNVRSQAYDLVLNGAEVAGGSIRIHNPILQKRILENFLKIDHSHLEHLLTALASGCPPHGGIALGIDRLISIICETTTIRDVIAFPKTIDGRDPLSGAPVELNKDEKALYHIQSIIEEK